MARQLEIYDAGRTVSSESRTVQDVLGEGPVDAVGAYFHVPFCFHKCHYCDFYSIVDSEDRQEVFVERLEEELACIGKRVTGPLETVFIGGGTPTLLRPALLDRLLGAIHGHLPLAAGVEWTVEANPETVDAEVAGVLASNGVSRASIGCQSFDRELLAMLERRHDPSNVGRAVAFLRDAGIESINLDLIMGIPGSTLEDWEQDLASALALAPSHLSCYGLQYEPNTPMTMKLAQGRFERIDEDIEASMYEHTCALLARSGFEHYEISNWALEGERCRHNLVYWMGGNWLAFGPSASGHLDGTRWKVSPRLSTWLEASPWAPVVDLEELGASTRAGERLMLELRLRDGIDAGELERLLEAHDESGARSEAIRGGLEGGLLETRDGRVRLTQKGLLLADTLLCDLV